MRTRGMFWYNMGDMNLISSLMVASLVGWTGVDKDDYLGGRKVSEGYLQGKVVLVNKWGDDAESRAQLPRLEQVWTSFKPKQFILLGSYCGDDSAAAQSAIKSVGLSYPVYRNAALAAREPEFDKPPYIYVLDAAGQIVYRGRDERLAEEAVVKAITNLGAPPTAKYWQKLIDAEKDVLPGRTYLHLLDFRKSFPKEAAAYVALYKELKAIRDIEKLAKLVEFARRARDYDPTAKRQKFKITKAKIEMAMKNGESLKKHDNPNVVQEAKNSLADLKWAAASF